MAARRESGNGLPVDYDPSKNVLDLVNASVRRIDDMAILRAEMQDRDIRHIHELNTCKAAHNQFIGKLREEYQEKLTRAEAGRLDSIRQVDREEVAKTAVSANQAITVLAKQTTDLATTLDKKVTDTATAAEQRNSAVNMDFNKRIAALELSSSEGKGKQQVSDPQLERWSALVEQMARNQDTGRGERRGKDDTIKWIIAGIGVLSTLVMLAGVMVTLVLFLNRSPQQQQPPIYVPAPTGTTLPTHPPGAVPQ